MFLSLDLSFSLAIVFYVCAILIHFLVIRKKIPFQFVNGGRSTSYEAQARQSKASVIILCIGLVYIILGITLPTLRKTILYMILSLLLGLLWLFGTVMQLLGTKFERYYLSWLNLIGTVAHINLALIYFVD